MKLIKSSTTLIAALACLGLTGAAMAQKEFEQNRDSFAQPGVPQGVMHHYVYTSKAGMFPGTVRDVWVYIPAQYDAAKPAALMVFQDGGGYVGRDGGYRLPNIVDNLIASLLESVHSGRIRALPPFVSFRKDHTHNPQCWSMVVAVERKVLGPYKAFFRVLWHT